jgi:hypothetical protein
MGGDDVSELRPPTGPLFIPRVMHEYREPLCNDTDKEKTDELEEKLVLLPPHPTWTDPGFLGERLATNGLDSCVRQSLTTLSHATLAMRPAADAQRQWSR